MCQCVSCVKLYESSEEGDKCSDGLSEQWPKGTMAKQLLLSCPRGTGGRDAKVPLLTSGSLGSDKSHRDSGVLLDRAGEHSDDEKTDWEDDD